MVNPDEVACPNVLHEGLSLCRLGRKKGRNYVCCEVKSSLRTSFVKREL